MKSMTGYSNLSFDSDNCALEITLKSVNGRYLDVRFHIPKEYASLEKNLKSIVQKSEYRGTIDVYIQRRGAGEGSQWNLEVRQDVAKKWVQAGKDLSALLNSQKGGGENLLTLSTLLGLPEVARLTEKTEVDKSEKEKLETFFEQAVAKLNIERANEGRVLKKELENLLEKLQVAQKSMLKLAQQSPDQWKQKLEQRWSQLDSEVSLDPQRVAQEIVFYVDRSDVSEEMVRLDAHLAEMANMIAAEGQPIGRKLDFYCQEVLREINTIGSKSASSDLTRLVVDSKGLIEQFREQVQNIE